jgi:dihydrofolate synthase / folylpolyglutamate synthase
MSTGSAARVATVQAWLDWQQTLHPRAIDLGLERVRVVAERLEVLTPRARVITVAGTNGKGSSVALLGAILSAAGYRVGSYTSPHLFRYNERIRIGGETVADDALMAAFETVDAARGEQTLSYFEFGTLAALVLFERADCDCWILEVGLGGRLDAVNIIDADGALVTNVGLDHMDWLGPDRESIGAEKAGVFRTGRPAVFGQADVPATVLAAAQAVPLRVAGRDYRWQLDSGGSWSFCGAHGTLAGLPAPALSGRHQYENAAAVLALLEALPALRVPEAAIRRGLREMRLPGRFEVLPGPVDWIFDVAHNRDSAATLAANLRERPTEGRTWAVFAQMQRKELDVVLAAMSAEIDGWFLLQLPDADARPSSEVAARLKSAQGEAAVAGSCTPADVRATVERRVRPGDRVVVFGSFRTVEEVLRGFDSART